MSNRLPVLAYAARSAHAAVKAHGRATAEAALAAGKALVEAKDKVPHGSWLGWLAETGIPERTAQRYILLVRGGLTSAMVADLGQATCARHASIGLRLWPGEEHAWAQACTLARDDRLAIWHVTDSGGVRYGLANLGNDRTDNWCGVYRPIMLPWVLGAVHDHWMDAHGKPYPQDLPEARSILDNWAGLSA